MTYVALANITLGSSASSVTFSSIPATFRDLVFIISGTVVTGSTDTQLRVNGDSGSNYSRVFMFGDGTNVASGSASLTGFLPWNGSTTQTVAIGQIMDYSATDKHKTLLSRQNTPNIGVSAQAQRWANTAAITTLNFLGNGNSYAAGTSFALYGIAS